MVQYTSLDMQPPVHSPEDGWQAIAHRGAPKTQSSSRRPPQLPQACFLNDMAGQQAHLQVLP